MWPHKLAEVTPFCANTQSIVVGISASTGSHVCGRQVDALLPDVLHSTRSNKINTFSMQTPSYFCKETSWVHKLSDPCLRRVFSLHIPTWIHSCINTGIFPPQPFPTSNFRMLKLSGAYIFHNHAFIRKATEYHAFRENQNHAFRFLPMLFAKIKIEKHAFREKHDFVIISFVIISFVIISLW